MRFLKWLFGPAEKGKLKGVKEEKYEKMPDFKKLFDSMPNIVRATVIPPVDSERKNIPSALERDAAKNIAENEAKAASSRDKVKEIYLRIQTAMSRNKQIVWLLRTDRETQHKSPKDLIKSYRNMRDKDSYQGMSVNYDSEGGLREISPLDERDVEGLDQKMNAEKKAGGKAFPAGR